MLCATAGRAGRLRLCSDLVGFAALAAAAMEFSSMYEHDTTELMNGMLDTDLARTPREEGGADPAACADDEEAAVAALMEQAKEEEEAFKGNRYTLGGFGWSREDRRPHRAPRHRATLGTDI